ncbi:MAG: hypothetical protein OQJ97_08250 [Rhodospirillales bacterium]|nr:hypothetical protein [Rhodospirillales bacterium]
MLVLFQNLFTRGFDLLVNVLKIATKITLPTILTYIGLIGVSFYFYPSQTSTYLDSTWAFDSYLVSRPAYITYSAHSIDTTRPAVVLIGASNTGVGFRPPELSKHLSGASFSDLWLGSARVNDYAAAIDLVYAGTPKDQRSNLVFVTGLAAGQTLRYPYRSVIIEQMERFGLFKQVGGVYKYSVNSTLFDISLLLLRPFFLLQSGLSNLKPFVGNRNTAVAELYKSEKPFTCLKTNYGFDEYHLDEYSRSQFDALLNLADHIKKYGGTLVLVDMPQPECFYQQSKLFKYYQNYKKPFYKSAISKGAVYLNFQDISSNRYFRDQTHVNAIGAAVISKKLADNLAPIINRLNGKP